MTTLTTPTSTRRTTRPDFPAPQPPVPSERISTLLQHRHPFQRRLVRVIRLISSSSRSRFESRASRGDTHILVSLEAEPPTAFWTRSEVSSVRSSVSCSIRASLFLDWSSLARILREELIVAVFLMGGRNVQATAAEDSTDHDPSLHTSFLTASPDFWFRLSVR